MIQQQHHGVVGLLLVATMVMVMMAVVGAAAAENVDPGDDFQGYMDYKDEQKIEAERIASMLADHEVSSSLIAPFVVHDVFDPHNNNIIEFPFLIRHILR